MMVKLLFNYNKILFNLPFLLIEDSIDVTNTNDVNIEADLSKQEPQTALLYNQTTYNYTQAVIFSRVSLKKMRYKILFIILFTF